MRIGLEEILLGLFMMVLWSSREVLGIRFIVEKEECFSYDVKYKGDTVHVSFVVIDYEHRYLSNSGVDLVVKGPYEDQIFDIRDKTSEKFEFVTRNKGIHRFCFTNKSPYHESVDFDVHISHFSFYGEHAKDEHFKPLLEQIAKLDESLHNIQFQQHWLEAQNVRQAIVNELMSKRAIHKVVFESVALIAASILQVYLLRRLFEKKIGISRV